MRPRDFLFLRACESLPESARRAVRLAEHYPGDDAADLGPGAAWLAAFDRPQKSASSIAEALQSAARRRRASAVIGPPRKRGKVTLDDRRRAENARGLRPVVAEPDPLAILEMLEAVAQAAAADVAVAGAAALLDSLCHASGTELASKLRVTPRRGQQIRSTQRAALMAGQRDLFEEEAL